MFSDVDAVCCTFSYISSILTFIDCYASSSNIRSFYAKNRKAACDKWAVNLKLRQRPSFVLCNLKTSAPST